MSPPPAATIPEALLATAARDSDGGYVFHLEDGAVKLSYPELVERAQAAARRLVALGVQPGEPVGVLGPNRPEWVVWAFGIWIAGAILVPVQIPLRVRDPVAFADQVRRLVEVAGCERVLADPRLAGLLADDIAVPWDQPGDESRDAGAAPTPQSTAVIQFTSGSTSAPKGAMIAHSAAMAQMEVLRAGYRHPDGAPRSVLGWTPFFHDLGLFANLVQPAVAGSTMHHLPTERFARDPAEWLRLVGETGAAATVAPASGFGKAVQLALRRGVRVDMSALEAGFFAAESVDPAIVQRMLEDARAFGFRPEALGASYGLAEAVMAVSYTRVGAGTRVDRVSVEDLVRSKLAAPVERGRARLVVGCGEPLMDVRIVGPEGELPDRHVGEILVRGASTMSGYVGEDASDPFVDGWLRTGDLGYLADGQLYPTGRAKDMVISMGHNYYPEDFEWAAGRVEGVRPGRCVAFTDPGAEDVVVVVEPSGDVDPAALERDVGRAAADMVGASPARVLVVPAGTVEKTTSGKLRRRSMRDAYLAGALPDARRPSVAPGG